MGTKRKPELARTKIRVLFRLAMPIWKAYLKTKWRSWTALIAYFRCRQHPKFPTLLATNTGTLAVSSDVGTASYKSC